MENEEKELEGEQEILDFNKPSFQFIANESHEYRQRGPYLICKSCEIEHATYVGMEKIMVGINKDGKPIMKTRKQLGM